MYKIISNLYTILLFPLVMVLYVYFSMTRKLKCAYCHHQAIWCNDIVCNYCCTYWISFIGWFKDSIWYMGRKVYEK